MAAGDGLVSMTPTSIAHSGTSAVINADGGVDFTAVTSLSLNGVFTSDYDNYLIVIQGTVDVDAQLRMRLRASGTDASGSDYATQYLSANNTSVTGAQATSQTDAQISSIYTSQGNGFNLHFYGPALTQPTAWRSVTIAGQNGGRINDFAVTHSASTAYDGCTFYTPVSDELTGNIHVFGYEE